MKRLRSTSAVTRFRQAHLSGRPVLLVIEVACLIPTIGALAWAAMSPGYHTLAAVYGVAIAVAMVLITAATLVIPDDSPRRPSWFQKQKPQRVPVVTDGVEGTA